jgi:hypothetical protein
MGGKAVGVMVNHLSANTTGPVRGLPLIGCRHRRVPRLWTRSCGSCSIRAHTARATGPVWCVPLLAVRLHFSIVAAPRTGAAVQAPVVAYLQCSGSPTVYQRRCGYCHVLLAQCQALRADCLVCAAVSSPMCAHCAVVHFSRPILKDHLLCRTFHAVPGTCTTSPSLAQTVRQ